MQDQGPALGGPMAWPTGTVEYLKNSFRDLNLTAASRDSQE